MSVVDMVCFLSEKVLYLPFLALLFGGIILSFKTKFIQLRTIPLMFKLLFGNIFKKNRESKKLQTIPSNKALFTAMSTTIGIGNIVSPIIAIGLGGPGALLGFMLATIFGGASTFTEVVYSLKFRKKKADGTVMGGPMQYLKTIKPFLAQFYAVAGFMLLIVWTTNQSNTLAVLLEPYHVPTYISGFITAIFIVFALIGGIKRVGNVSEKIVPFMFFLYVFAMLWIVGANIQNLIPVIVLIFKSAFSPKALGGAAVGVGIHKALHWGLSKSFFSNEAGLGVSGIPHSMAATDNAFNQGVLSVISVYANGILCLLSGLAILVTGLWQVPGLRFDINMLNRALALYFPGIGPIILVISSLLFAFSTILGNSYNGSQCFLYVTKNRWIGIYYSLVTVVVFLGAIASVDFVWAFSDFFMALIAVPHIVGLVMLAFRHGADLTGKKKGIGDVS
jgi:alanine or glycine:cation symporter, AGCS family